LIAERLAATSGHDDAGVASCGDALDNALPGRGGRIRSPNSDAMPRKSVQAPALGGSARPPAAPELPSFSLPSAVTTVRVQQGARCGLQCSLLFPHMSNTISATPMCVPDATSQRGKTRGSSEIHAFLSDDVGAAPSGSLRAAPGVWGAATLHLHKDISFRCGSRRFGRCISKLPRSFAGAIIPL